MSKELPYFKFYIADWISGDITLEDFNVQGLFVNICAYYWSKDCEVSLINLRKKFRGYDDEINTLIDSNIIKITSENVTISFLNEQLTSKEVQKITNKINGQKGGRPKTLKTETKPNGLFFANRNLTDSITETEPNDNPNLTNIKERKGEISIITPVEKTTAIDFSKFIKFFNSKADRNFRVTEKIKTALKARLKEYSKTEILQAITNAHLDSYHIETDFKYLTPEFILRPDKLEKFLNQPNAKKLNGYTVQGTN